MAFPFSWVVSILLFPGVHVNSGQTASEMRYARTTDVTKSLTAATLASGVALAGSAWTAPPGRLQAPQEREVAAGGRRNAGRRTNSRPSRATRAGEQIQGPVPQRGPTSKFKAQPRNGLAVICDVPILIALPPMPPLPHPKISSAP